MSDWVVHTGDCLEILKTLPAGSVDAVVTDPPFGIDFAGRPTKWQRLAGAEPRDWDKEPGAVVEFLNLAPVIVVWGGNYFRLPTSRGWFVWYKPDAPPSMGDVELAWTNRDTCARSITHSIGATNAERCGHPTQKPVRVMRWCLEQLGLEPGKTVLDPYCGSGTTGVACMQMGLNFIGIEIDPGYADIARRRIAEAANHLFSQTGHSPR